MEVTVNLDKRKRYKLYLLVFAGCLTAFGPVMTDFYLPSLPQLQQWFATSTSLVQLSLTFGMIGLGVGQLFIGPLSDKYGRKYPLSASLGLFALATTGCVFSGNVYVFLAFRLLQGIAGAGGVVIARSVAVDLYAGAELSRFFALISSIQGIAPIAAPILGGILLEFTDWRGIFGVLLLFGVALLALVVPFRESHPVGKRVEGSVWATFARFVPIVKNRKFMRYVLTQAAAFGVLFGYIAASPFIFQEHFRLSPAAYSLCFGINAACIMFGSLLVTRFRDEEKALSVASAVFAAVCLAVSAAFILDMPFAVVESGMVLMGISFGTLMPPTTSLALGMERNNSGNASALLGFVQFLFGGIVSPLVGIGGNVLAATGVIIAAFGLLSFAVCPWKK